MRYWLTTSEKASPAERVTKQIKAARTRRMGQNYPFRSGETQSEALIQNPHLMMLSVFFFRRKKIPKSIEILFPHKTMVVDPALEDRQPSCVKAACSNSTDLLAFC